MSTASGTAASTGSAGEYEVDPGFPKTPDNRPLGEVAGVMVDGQDRVYVVNRSDVPVQIFAKDGEFISEWDYTDFTRVHSVTLGADGRIYIADDQRHVVRVFDADGNLVLTLGKEGVPSDTGVVGSDVFTVKRAGPPFNLPTDAAVGADGSIFVTDGYGNARVHHFTQDGELLHSWGSPGSGPGEFVLPHGVKVDANGRVLVADRENNRIQVFAPDGSYLTEFGDLFRPCGLCLDGEGNIYVAELGPSHGRVSILDADGKVKARWGIVGEVPSAGGHSIAVDSDGSIYVGLVYQGFPPPRDAHPVIKYRRK